MHVIKIKSVGIRAMIKGGAVRPLIAVHFDNGHYGLILICNIDDLTD